MQIEGVLKTTRGACRLSRGTLVCTAVLAPPKCSCQPGGSMTVDFVAHLAPPTTSVVSRSVGGGSFKTETVPHVHVGIVNGVVEVDAMTPVPYKIPSVVGKESPQEDLPLCARAHPPGKVCVRPTSNG
jgi:hypothetical protein